MLEAVEAEQCLEACLLRRVLGQRGIAEHPPAQREERRPVAGEQHGERTCITLPGSLYQRAVAVVRVHGLLLPALLPYPNVVARAGRLVTLRRPSSNAVRG